MALKITPDLKLELSDLNYLCSQLLMPLWTLKASLRWFTQANYVSSIDFAGLPPARKDGQVAYFSEWQRFSSEQFSSPAVALSMASRKTTFKGSPTKCANPSPKDRPTRPAHIPMRRTLRTTKQKSPEMRQGSVLCCQKLEGRLCMKWHRRRTHEGTASLATLARKKSR